MNHFTLVALLAALAGCTHPTPAQTAAIDCAKQVGSAEVTEPPAILAALAKEDWYSAVEELLAKAGPGVLCEGEQLLQVLKGASTPTPTGFVDTGTAAKTIETRARLSAWLDVHVRDYKL